MMKLGLALLAIGATATQISADIDNGNECLSAWAWDECTDWFYQHDYCKEFEDGEEKCGWWFSPSYDDVRYDDVWIFCSDWKSWCCTNFYKYC